MSSKNTTNTLLTPPRLIQRKTPQPKNTSVTEVSGQERFSTIEVSLHTLPKPLKREFRHVFNEAYLQFDNKDSTDYPAVDDKVLLAIPTNQHALVDLVSVGDHVEQEKDRLLNVFLEFAEDICAKIRNAGYWADFIDPCSGLPMLTMNCNKVYSEVDGMECLLNYKSYSAGFCKILVHPKFGSSVYPATMFACAPPKLVMQILEQYPYSEEVSSEQ